MDRRVHIEVRGRVQGVGFRMFICHRALELGLCGRVRNTGHGTVSIDVQGAAGLVEELISAARTGPPASSVSGIDTNERPLDFSMSGFRVTD
ncbi:acylphosphatase [Prosthecochloris sp. N3]|uniref:acylphosphatase n=1 Tax=Prosthecochloris ethylica TaxID=2743976 RepID=A0ABR9XST7_9CHLB|nr:MULTISPECIES: acylphosphatase [Prosthecochloris]MBF0585927.1 acylphosphatase [Prosthecochloris ethylica]MBF0637068.1 acylphosphatase [Prosthecochloris ethylica]NUK47305.1 acylphosphatase [Prosthecochloris ethylica]RNA64095.1 acylphosphatase [Prosthecochloris sp. ZM_2]